MGLENTPFTMDVVPAGSGNCNGGNGMWGGDWSAWIILFLIFAIFGWGGYGNGGNGSNGSGFQGYATRADITEGFAFNNLDNGIRDVQASICDATAALQNSIQNGFNTTQISMMQGFNGVQTQICTLASQLQQCCCDIREAVQQINYNMSMQTNQLQQSMNMNTRDIIDNQNAGTRAILDYLCNEKISTLQQENQALRLQASQADQNAFIRAAIEAGNAEILRRTGNDCPIPAYVVPNPNCCYGTPYGVLNGACNNNCGCNNGCACGYA